MIYSRDVLFWSETLDIDVWIFECAKVKMSFSDSSIFVQFISYTIFVSLTSFSFQFVLCFLETKHWSFLVSSSHS